MLGAFNNRNSFSHGPEPGPSMVRVQPLPALVRGVFLACRQVAFAVREGEGEGERSGVSYKGTEAIMKTPPGGTLSNLNYLPKALSKWSYIGD